MVPVPKIARFIPDPVATAIAGPVAAVAWSALAWCGLLGPTGALHVFLWPMSPLTTLCMALLTSALFAIRLAPGREATWRWARIVWAGVGAAAAMVLLAHARGADLALERWLWTDPIPARDVIRQELKWLGRMSPVTAGTLLLLAPVPALLRRHRQATAALALGVLGVGLALLMGFVMGTTLIHWEGLSPTCFLSDLSFLCLGAAGLGLAGFEVRPLSLLVLQGNGAPLRPARGAVLAILGASLLVFGGAVLYIRVQRRSVQRAARRELAAIADLECQQIAGWVGERMDDAEVLARSTLARGILGAQGEGDPAQVRWLEVVRQRYAYASIAFFDSRARLRLAAPADRGSEEADSRPALILSPERVSLEDFHRGPEGIHFALWAPVQDPTGRKLLGTLRLQVDPERYLYPLLRTWPAASRTGEIQLWSQAGEQVVCLSPSRHQEGTALALRRNLAEHPELPAVQAALGHVGEQEGVDSRGVPVLAAVRRIPGTPWFIVVQVDQSEVVAPLRLWGWTTVLLAGGILGAALLGIGLQVRRAELRHAARRLELERTAKAMAERFHHLMREANDLILLADGDRMVLEANRRAEERYGVAPGGLRGASLRSLLAPGGEAGFEAGMAELARTSSARFETLHRNAQGAVFPISLSLRRVEFDGVPYLLATGRDITEHKCQERKLERLSRLYAALSQVNLAIVRSPDRTSLFQEICRVIVEQGDFHHAWIAWHEPATRTARILAERGRSMGLLARCTIRTDDCPEGRGPTGTAIREERTVVSNDLDADPRLAAFRELVVGLGISAMGAFPIRLAGQVCGALAVASEERDVFRDQEIALLEEAAMDVSFALDHQEEVASRSRAEEEARLQAEYLRLAAASAELGVWELDLRKGIGTLDERMREIYGLPGVRELSEEAWRERLHPDDRERVLPILAEAVRSASTFSLTYRIVRPNGQVRVVKGDGLFIKDASGRAIRGVGLNRDLTDELRQEEERRSLQIQLYQAQKLESLGILAGGVAHDMNNVLGAILSRASAEREVLEPSASASRAMDVIVSACLRGRGVVKGLLCFARQELEAHCPVDLNALAREIVQLLAYTTLKRVSFVMDLQEPTAKVLGDGGALAHAVMNLCVNSVDAMPGGGTITLRTRVLPEGWVQLRVEDTGEGMAPAVLEKAMEPFFTTKPPGKGTGLGLSMVFGTVNAHHGAMTLESEPGRGTVVSLRFPAAPAGTEVPAPVPVEAAEPAATGPLHILLVDDDELIRDSVGPMLEMQGHRVDLADNGLSALQMLEGGLRVDLVILDMNMPGLNGAETLPRILALRPDQAVLMSSGYTEQDVQERLESHGRVSSIRKPFSLKELQAKLGTMALGPPANPGI